MRVVVVAESAQDAAPLLGPLLAGLERHIPVTVGIVAPVRPWLSHLIPLSGAGAQLVWDDEAIRGRACHQAHLLLAHVPDHLAARACVFTGWRDVVARLAPDDALLLVAPPRRRADRRRLSNLNRRRLMHPTRIAAVAATALAIGASAPAADAATQPPTPSFALTMQRTGSAPLAPGLWFLDPHQLSPSGVAGPMITDDAGRVVWYHPVPKGQSAANFRVQRYRGRPVLTWWQGTGGNPALGALSLAVGEGEAVIMDDHYKVIRTIKDVSGDPLDSHELFLTPQGTALISFYKLVPHVDLTSVGGPADGTVLDSIVREVDIATGQLLLDWSALAHVPLTDSHATLLSPSAPWDFFHVNSIALTPDGQILVGARHTWALYAVNRTSGAIDWTLGGKRSDFTLGPGAQFAWQHDAHFAGPTDLELFDDESGLPYGALGSQSRGLSLHVDFATRQVTRTREVLQPSGQAQTSTQGSYQTLTGGHAILGWGNSRTFSEHDASGRLLLLGTMPAGPSVTIPAGLTLPNDWQTYRAFKFPWHGTPTARPVITSAGGASVQASWNGATAVARWRVDAGPSRGALRPRGTGAWTGLVSNVSLHGSGLRYARAVALGSDGKPLGRSAIVRLR